MAIYIYHLLTIASYKYAHEYQYINTLYVYISILTLYMFLLVWINTYVINI